MNTYQWAKNELKLARENEIMKWKANPDYREGDERYGLMIYDDAEQLLNVFFEAQRHSRFSASVVRQVFDRLVEGQPLLPVKDVDDQWEQIDVDDDKICYRHMRMSALFKNVYNDGKTTYRDVRRVVARDQNNLTYYNGLVDEIIEEYFPFNLPYVGEKINVRVYDVTNIETPEGQVDLRHIIDAIKDGWEHVYIDRYFMLSDDDEDWREIDVFIYRNILKNSVANTKEETDNG